MPAEHSLRDHGGQEAVERLLGAAVGIVDEVRQGVDHRAGQASASSGPPPASRTGGGPRGPGSSAGPNCDRGGSSRRTSRS